jgi:hypothetical protein
MDIHAYKFTKLYWSFEKRPRSGIAQPVGGWGHHVVMFPGLVDGRRHYIFIGCLKLFAPTLFTIESSSFSSSERLAMVEAFPSINCFRCFCCSWMTSMSRRVASTLILSNWLRILYLEDGRGEGTY